MQLNHVTSFGLFGQTRHQSLGMYITNGLQIYFLIKKKLLINPFLRKKPLININSKKGT